jgi:hypothetical protein
MHFDGRSQMEGSVGERHLGRELARGAWLVWRAPWILRPASWGRVLAGSGRAPNERAEAEGAFQSVGLLRGARVGALVASLVRGAGAFGLAGWHPHRGQLQRWRPPWR